MSQSQSVVFFVDRCLDNKLVVETLRRSGITVEIHDDHFEKGAQDVDRVPEIGKRGWVVLTKDANIGKRTSEKIAVVIEKCTVTVCDCVGEGVCANEVIVGDVGKCTIFIDYDCTLSWVGGDRNTCGVYGLITSVIGKDIDHNWFSGISTCSIVDGSY